MIICSISVHPRVCGEQDLIAGAAARRAGSSPRVRGTAHHVAFKGFTRRFIPACAGNSYMGYASYPGRHGSSPRVRGTAAPRDGTVVDLRFIPACAGNSGRNTSIVVNSSVHPRVCGEQPLALRAASWFAGSSPRVRGTAGDGYTVTFRDRFIPACAGNSPKAISESDTHSVHPRVCGEQATSRSTILCTPGSSPRVRGTVRNPLMDTVELRFIPACAGNRQLQLVNPATPAVHPRVCGEQSPFGGPIKPATGSSPHVRGTVSSSTGAGMVLPVHPRVCGEQSRRPN